MSLVGADHRSCPSSGCCRGESQQGLTWSRADEANHKLCWNYLTPNFFSSLKLVSPSPGLLAGILGAVNVWVSVAIVATTKRSREIAIGLQPLTEYFDTVVGWEENGKRHHLYHPCMVYLHTFG